VRTLPRSESKLFELMLHIPNVIFIQQIKISTWATKF